MIPAQLPPLVTTDWLAAHLGEPGLVVLDASWYLPNSGRDPREEFRLGHIPGSRFFDLDAASAPDTSLPHMLPDATRFAAVASALGIENEAAIVIYDGSGTNLSAARVWWMFRVFGHPRVTLLDGGAGKWRSEGRALERGEAVTAPRTFQAKLDPTHVVGKRDVATALASGLVQVVDMRPAGRFEGTEPEPRPGLPSGHMPGAISLPHGEMVHADGTALTPEELRDLLERRGIRLDRRLIATCGSATSACTLLHALHRLGMAPQELYDGAWTEWAGSGMPVETGLGRRPATSGGQGTAG